ncbi:MAG: LCP family protein [Solirubrobacteraceae bacterium]
MSVIDSDQNTSLGAHTKKFVLGGVLIVLFTAIAVASALLIEVQEDLGIIRDASPPIADVKNVLDDVPAGAPQTILLLGSDRRFADTDDNPPRSDTIIVVRLDPDKNATAIMSLPRDLRVDVPGHGIRRINEAYHLGGPNLSIRTVQLFLGLDINHVINVNFGGFRRAVDRLGCVYADIDRRYFNDNTGPQPNYATIDLKPGYQKLCGQDALDYVRFRHEDSDFVRASRQQEFLRQAKDQVGLGRLLEDRKELLRIFGAYTQTDIAQRDSSEILGLLKLAYESSKSPVTEVRFPGTDGSDGFVEISSEELTRTVDSFIDVRGADAVNAPKKPRRIEPAKGLAPGLVLAREQGEDHVLAMDLRLRALGLPVVFPKARLARGGYVQTSSPRSYEIFDRNKQRHRAYRIVLSAGEVGEFYGVQGTTWKAAPILDNPTDEVRMRGRTYKRYFDGRRIRLLAWDTPQAVYWVSNTLSQKLTNRQMLEIARSLQPISGSG